MAASRYSCGRQAFAGGAHEQATAPARARRDAAARRRSFGLLFWRHLFPARAGGAGHRVANQCALALLRGAELPARRRTGAGSGRRSMPWRPAHAALDLARGERLCRASEADPRQQLSGRKRRHGLERDVSGGARRCCDRTANAAGFRGERCRAGARSRRGSCRPRTRSPTRRAEAGRPSLVARPARAALQRVPTPMRGRALSGVQPRTAAGGGGSAGRGARRAAAGLDVWRSGPNPRGAARCCAMLRRCCRRSLPRRRRRPRRDGPRSRRRPRNACSASFPGSRSLATTNCSS